VARAWPYLEASSLAATLDSLRNQLDDQTIATRALKTPEPPMLHLVAANVLNSKRRPRNRDGAVWALHGRQGYICVPKRPVYGVQFQGAAANSSDGSEVCDGFRGGAHGRLTGGPWSIPDKQWGASSYRQGAPFSLTRLRTMPLGR